MGFLNLEGLRYLTAQLKTLFATKTYVDEKFENSGTVKSVANIGPDGTGNVALTAENIQAIPNTAAVVSYLEDGTPGDAIPLNADTLGGRPAEDFALIENGLPTVEASKSGTVFQIDSVEAQQFILVPDADYVDGDTFTIAGRSVEAKLPNGTSLPGNFFIAGAKIICLLNNNTLYFAAGGGAGGGGAGTAKLCIYKAVFTQEGWTLKTDEGTSESWYEQTVALEVYNTNKSATANTVLLTPMFMKGESEEENSANAELVSFINDSGQVSVGDATVTVKAVLDSAPNVSGTVYWASTDVVRIAGGGSVPDNVMLYRMDDGTPGQQPEQTIWGQTSDGQDAYVHSCTKAVYDSESEKTLDVLLREMLLAELPQPGQWNFAPYRISYGEGGVNAKRHPWVNFDDDLDKTVYAALYAAIGDTMSDGAADGMFNCKKLAERFPLVCGANFSVPVAGGEKEHTLTVEELPEHKHVMPYTTGSGASAGVGYKLGTSETQSWSATLTTGAGKAHNNMPPYIVQTVHVKS